VDTRSITISVVIVNFRVPEFLLRTIQSIREADLFENTEVIVVDNASQDNSQELVSKQFPEVQWIGLKNNIGFGKACNVGAQSARGKFLLLLNPDTLISKNTLSVCVDFFNKNAGAGIMGPKIMKPDGTLQPDCKRSFPSPLVGFYKLIGLSGLFPKNKLFGQYNLTWLAPDKAAKVDAVSGSFMFMPLALFRQVGGFDESFFMYGEDLDICCKVKAKGFDVWYNPETQIIHFKGKSSKKSIWKSRVAFYEAMIIFSRKYRHTQTVFFPDWLITLGISCIAAANFITNLFRTFTACFIDLLLINTTLFAGITIRFHVSLVGNPYFSGTLWTMLLLHAIISFSFLGLFFARGVYSQERYTITNTIAASIVASMVFMTAVFFFNSLAFSRLAFAVSTIVITSVLIGWREALPKLTRQFRRLVFSSGTVVIVGTDTVATAVIKNIEQDKTATISGILWPTITKDQHPGQFQGYPVLGTIESIKDVLSRQKVDLLLIATDQPWYSYVIEALSSLKVKNLTIRWVPTEIFSIESGKLPEVIPLRDFSV
jgi:GT2 family glycosyltransferase